MPLCILEVVEVPLEALRKTLEVVLYMTEVVNGVRCVLWVLGFMLCMLFCNLLCKLEVSDVLEEFEVRR